MSLELHRANSLGGIISLLALALCILIFLFRLGGMPAVERWLGILLLATACLLYTSDAADDWLVVYG